MTVTGDSLPPEPSGWVDELTGLDGPTLWDREIAKENARNRRYRRTATVAIAEIHGFGGVVSTYGADLALQAFQEACRVLGAETRSSDYAARIGPIQLGFLLVESNENGAARFAERVRSSFERAIGPGRELTIELGWASPKPYESLTDAQTRAAERLATPTVADQVRAAGLPTASEGRRDPWWDLEGIGVAAARRRRQLHERTAFAFAALADVMTAALWVLQLSGLVRVPLPH